MTDNIAEEVYSSSVFLNGRPRSPLNSLRNRLSLELDGRRMISGATRLPVSRRARRPLSQSSQLIGSFMGMVGTPDFEKFGLFMDQFFHVIPVLICLGAGSVSEVMSANAR